MPKPTEAALWLANALTMKFGGDDRFPYTYDVDKAGRKFDRIMQEGNRGNRSVHCFIERSTGAVLMPAGLAAPAAGTRYPSVQIAINFADRHGSYLYMDACKTNMRKCICPAEDTGSEHMSHCPLSAALVSV